MVSYVGESIAVMWNLEQNSLCQFHTPNVLPAFLWKHHLSIATNQNHSCLDNLTNKNPVPLWVYDMSFTPSTCNISFQYDILLFHARPVTSYTMKCKKKEHPWSIWSMLAKETSLDNIVAKVLGRNTPRLPRQNHRGSRCIPSNRSLEGL